MTLLIVRGGHEHHTSAEQRLQHVLRRSMDRVVHLGIYKGGALSEFSVRGSMGSRMFLKERDYLGFPFALDVKGGA